MFLLTIFFIAIAVFLYINDKNTPEEKNEQLRREVVKLNEELIKAKGSGEKEKIAKIENEIKSKLPDNLKRLVDHVKENNFDLDFYGKIVDQYGDPVVNAKINYYMSSMYNLQTNARGSVKTDKAGLFNIKASGYTLSLKMPEHSMLSNKYMPGTAKTPFLSGSSILLEPEAAGRSIQSWKGYGKNNPYIIRSWRVDKFEDILHDKYNISITDDGEFNTYIKNDRDNKVYAKKGIDKNGYLLMSCNRDKSGYMRKKGDWNITIKAIEGGVQEASGFIYNEVPIDGYLSSININMKEEQSNYVSRLKNKRYYFTAQNGQVNGALVITYKPFSKKNRCLMSVDYKINTNGSRNIAIKK